MDIINIEPMTYEAEEIFHLLKDSISTIKKIWGCVRQEKVSRILSELEVNKFNIEKYRRWQVSPDINFIQLTLKNPDTQNEFMRQKLDEIRNKYFEKLDSLNDQKKK